MLTDKVYHAISAWPNAQRQLKRAVLRLPHRRRIVERFGQRLIVDPSELHGFYLYYEREYDDYIFRFLDKRLNRYTRALDIGANIGIYSIFLGARVSRVDAFEPESALAAWLSANLELNGLENVTVHETCVGEVTGTVKFLSADKRNRGVGGIAAAGQRGVDRSCVSLDDFLSEAQSERCLIKMDIEGGEWLALNGARRALARAVGLVDLLLEVHPEEIRKLGGSVEQLRQLLTNLGMRVSALTSDGLRDLKDQEPHRFWWVTTGE